ncbi:prephenate dehydratase domain-containing protein [Candidatus Tachikawaea gelatinosa]|uniref:Bifunctional chorismate mutase/prephenate dehydratase n=1 Tax=Candidatus Tachikawaea gelatinosa TaxID=1410383 RepID=A0A090BWI2_9ENTR|nr:prephenate dehydratase domain-containing protein [Candidatus Tachikawaea gelatinosa]BAP58651.1 fused chorismate mutase P/prephenate dehydratase [Candidatus Tachikawaea gelatinosa]
MNKFFLLYDILRVLFFSKNIIVNYKNFFKTYILFSINNFFSKKSINFFSKKKNNKLHQQTKKIAFLGPEGTYSHLVTRHYMNCFKNISFSEKKFLKFKDIFKNVEDGESDFGIVPLENTNSGLIHDVYHLLRKTKLFIIAEVNMCINHCILVSQDSDLNNIKKIYSHPQPFKQCSNFIKNFSHWEIKYTESTAIAMKKIKLINSSKIAAIGSEYGGKIYKLKVLKRFLNNDVKNFTRFVVLSRNSVSVPYKISAKTTFMFIADSEKQTLLKIFLIFKKYNIIFHIIDSRFIHNNRLKKIYFIDIKSNMHSNLMKNILEKIKNLVYFIKILGCYPNTSIVI